MLMFPRIHRRENIKSHKDKEALIVPRNVVRCQQQKGLIQWKTVRCDCKRCMKHWRRPALELDVLKFRTK